jgi:hypothetical protein
MAAAITEAQVINNTLLNRRSLLSANDKPDGRRFSPAVIIKALLTLMVVGQRKRRIPFKETCNCWASF